MTAQVFLSAQFFFGQNLFILLQFTELAMFLYFSGICTLTMGTKGEQHTGDAKISAEFFCERLSRIAGITSKKMFGGYGIFHEGKMFALVNSSGQVYLKSDDTIMSKFDQVGAQSHGKMPYFSIPESVFNDPEILVNWAQESIDISKK